MATSTTVILEPDETFDFSQLSLTSPIMISGGNYFIKYLVNKQTMYIQPPKCQTRQGIMKAGMKRFYCDLLFTNENESFVKWMEELEQVSQQKLFENRTRWFETELELHDIETSFTSSFKIFKSGKYYVLRVWVPSRLGECSLKLFDENEHPLDIQEINEHSQVMTILEVQGIRCSTRNFQIDFELKQMMMLRPEKLFEQCLMKRGNSSSVGGRSSMISTSSMEDQEYKAEPNLVDNTTSMSMSLSNDHLVEPFPELSKNDTSKDVSISTLPTHGIDESTATTTPTTTNTPTMSILPVKEENVLTLPEEEDVGNSPIDAMVGMPTSVALMESTPTPPTIPSLEESNEFQEVNIMDLVNDTTTTTTMDMTLPRNLAYNPQQYQLYRQAREKAKQEQQLALTSYLEAKSLKKQYQLGNIPDSDSEFEISDGSDDEEEEEDVYTVHQSS